LIHFTLNTIDYEIFVPEDAQSGYAASVTEKSSQKEFMMNPFEPVGIFFETQEVANQIGVVAGETYIFPAFYFLWLKNDSDNEKIKQGISDAVLLGSFFYGGAELALARNIVKFTFSAIQLGISTAGVILDENTREDLRANGYGDFLAAFDVVSIISEASSINKQQYINGIYLINIWNSSKDLMSNYMNESQFNEMNTLIENLNEEMN